MDSSAFDIIGYLDRLFYFSLKKTGDRAEAEELAQEIAFEAMTTLNKGHAPADFTSWLWGVARNCYARWVARRKKICLDTDGIQGLSDGALEDDFIEKEQLQLLRRELALLAREYREIVVAYYIDRRKLSDIASLLRMPEGTVKRKLFESRKHLREGMHMARSNGQRSYAPENIGFSASGSFTEKGTPWPLLERAIPKNILLEAYNNPCTIEDLSLALGIAAPYMEEEVRLLTEGTLLKCLNDGRFETDFVIVDRDMRIDNLKELIRISRSFCPIVLELLDAAIDEIKGIGFTHCDMPPEKLYWLLLPRIVDTLCLTVQADKGASERYTQRPHDAEWDIIGFENGYEVPADLPLDVLNSFVGLNGCGSAPVHFSSYKIRIDEHDLWNRAGEIQLKDAMLLADILRNRRERSSLSAVEQSSVDELVRRGFLACNGGTIETTFPVFNDSKLKQKRQLNALIGREFAGQPCQLVSELYDVYMKRIQSSVPQRLEHQAKFVAGSHLSDLRVTVYQYALAQQRIEIPEDIGKSAIAMMMVI